MKSKKYFLKFSLIVGIITLLGFGLRFLSCYWGYPYQLHPDEPVIVDNVIDMLSRHSWEAYVYNRPDQFEIKGNAVLFTIVSEIKYHMPAYEAYDEHKMAFFLLARFFTAIWGTAMIPLSVVFSGHLLKGCRIKIEPVQVIIAGVVAFSPVFVQHSAYATPDITLTFFVLLFSYFFMLYMEDGKRRDMICCAVIVGISISIKYPAAIMCIPVAFMITYRAIFVDKAYKNIIKYGLASILFVCGTVFIIAPNLFTDFCAVYQTLLAEAAPGHLGADGLGCAGNLIYYIKMAIQSLGYISVIPFLAGLYFILRNRCRSFWALAVGVVYWICLSVLSLHWQ